MLEFVTFASSLFKKIIIFIRLLHYASHSCGSESLVYIHVYTSLVIMQYNIVPAITRFLILCNNLYCGKSTGRAALPLKFTY